MGKETMFNLFRKSQSQTAAKAPAVNPATKAPAVNPATKAPAVGSNTKVSAVGSNTKVSGSKPLKKQQQQRTVPKPAPRSFKPSPAINRDTYDNKIAKEQIENGKNNRKDTETKETAPQEGDCGGCVTVDLAESIRELL